MKKLLLILAIAPLLVMCGSKKTATTGDTAAKALVQYKDDFRAASNKEKKALLAKLKATGESHSVLIFTSNFKGEKITASNSKGQLYSGYPMSNLKTGIAESIRIDNTLDTKIHDNLTKKDAIIEAKEAQKHKFVYVMKDKNAGNTFVITYSNTLRPLE